MTGRFRWGLFMAVSLVLGTEPVSLLAVPHPGLTSAAVLAEGTAPSGGAAADGTTMTETSFDMEVAAGASNFGDLSGVPGAVLKASGNPTSALTLTTSVAVPGVPNTTARYRYTVGANTFGANEPIVMGVPETVHASTSGSGYVLPSVCTTPDGVVHVAYENRTSGNGTLRYRARSATTELWGTAFAPWAAATNTAQTSGSGGYLINPSIGWTKSDGSTGYALYIAAWYATSTSSQTLRIAVSLDGGSTWGTYVSDLVLAFSGTLYYEQMQVTWDELGEQWMLTAIKDVAGTKSLVTYVSNDPTMARWTALSGAEIANVAGVASTSYCGTYYAATMISAGSAVALRKRTAADVVWTVVTTDTGANFDIAYRNVLVVNDSGWLYLMGRNSADADEIQTQVSVNRGYTWGAPSGDYPYGDSAATVVVDDDADSGTTTLTNGILIGGAAWTGETLWLAGHLVTSATTVDNSIITIPFGGISNITADGALAGVDAPYYPTVIPETKSPAYGAFVTSGATTQTITTDSSGRLVCQLSNNNSTGYNTYSTIGDPSVTGALWAIGPGTSGGDVTSAEIAMLIGAHNDAVTDNYQILVNIDWDLEDIRVRNAASTTLVTSTDCFDNTLPLYVLAALNGNTGAISVYVRQPGALSWTAVLDGGAATSIVGVVGSSVTFGKIAASTAVIDTLAFLPLGSSSSGFVANLADGIDTTDILGIRAVAGQSDRKQRIPHGVNLWWHGSPLHNGDAFTASTVSRTPLKRAAAYSANGSPSAQYVSATLAAGATVREVFDLTYETRLTTGLMFVGGANLGPVDTLRLRRWNGSAWGTIIEGNGYEEPFGASGSVAFLRGSAASLIIAPNGTNGSPQALRPDQWTGRWARLSDGTDAILFKIGRVFPGQFMTGTGVLQAGFEIDYSTLTVESGNFSNLATSTTTGQFRLYHDDIVIIGASDQDTVRYYAIEADIADAATTMRAGMLTAGPAYLLPRNERDGSSIRFLSPDEVASIPGSNFMQAHQQRRKEQRIVEMPYDQILVQPGYYSGAGSTINTVAFSGSTARTLIDSNLETIQGVRRTVGQRAPVGLVPWARFSADPGSSNAVFGGEQVLWGKLPAQWDRTASRGVLRDHGRHAEAGGVLLLPEWV